MDTETKNPILIWRFRVPSKSHPGTLHIVEIYESGDMRCDCIANQMGNVCRHIKGTMDFLEKLIVKLRKNYGKNNN